MIKDNPYLTFIFEYISLKDIHTVNYKEEQQGLYLIGIRDVTNGKQWFYSDVKEMAKRYDDENLTEP
jgi:tRNA splicing ligase